MQILKKYLNNITSLPSAPVSIWATYILIFPHKSIPLAYQQLLPCSSILWQYLSSKRSPRNEHHIHLVGLHRSREISFLQHSHNAYLHRLRWQQPFSCSFMALQVPLSFVCIDTPHHTTLLFAARPTTPMSPMPHFVGLLTVITKSCGKRHLRLQPSHRREAAELSSNIMPLLTKMTCAWQHYGTTLPP